MDLSATSAAPLAFGTDGVRGRVPDQFNLGLLTQLGKGICTWLLAEGADGVLSLPGVPPEFDKPFSQALLVSYDRRPDSAEFALHLAKVCAAYGFRVHLTPDYAPTPAIAYAAREGGYDCALIVTASHNPYTDNGLKLKPHYGGSATGEITSRVEAAMAAPATPACATSRDNAPVLHDIQAPYMRTVRELLDLEAGLLPDMVIQFDAMHGATVDWFGQLTVDTGLVVNQLHGERATPATHLHPEPLGQWLGECIAAVKRTPGSVGIACDGDGDRLGLIDETGRFLSSQIFYPLILLSRLKLRDLPVPAIAKTFSGTLLLDRIAAQYQLQCHEVPVGYKHISLMLATGEIAMGGEESGGLGFVEFIPERDGMYSGLMTLRQMHRRGMTLAALVDELQAEFGPVFFERRDLPLQRVASRSELDTLVASATRGGSFAGRAIERTETMDGVKLWLDGAWVLLRPSGTEALLRLYCEANSLGSVTELLDAAVALVGAPEHGLVQPG